ncbi:MULTISPECIES: GNAT family N-acetyltransferase [unclassified Nostoc]|uniref:GNAT family N-acetyltransferase n=1 Tax=unclassified Nostoc TaxID=2593658 RepID=UPI0025AB18C5|nr:MULTISPECIES: GNAT family N-acetyltransferase [unclassified Nostoc]MDM9582432.1 GNAT family N-acetyltransferase [Nostoc sp. GT001]MDZ7944623.1 GNAT family N-acetyltransferase [Nostoc sp. EfeVER01]MDZ7993671.1 GNAT family N-acetyltransferase [Nostoc sp. EspVER01]
MFNLRQANLQDLEALIQLRLELLREVGEIKGDFDITNLAEATRRYLGEKMPSGEFLAWVAEVDSQIVATSGLVFFQRPPYNGNLSGLEAYIMNVYTIPMWRGQGIATALLKEIISFMRATEAKRLWLHATEDGKRVYEKLSFVSTAKEMEIVWY